MNVDRDFVSTVQPHSRKSVRMKRETYDALKKFILAQLEGENQVTFESLLGKAQEEFYPALGDLTSWHLFQVKLDLEAKGLIRNEISKKKKRQTFIKRMSHVRKLKMTDTHQPDSLDVQIEVNEAVKEKFISLFSSDPMMVHSPGRINLIGEHTDYNNGFVMPAAINKGIQFAFGQSKRPQSIIFSIRYNQFFSIDHSSLGEVASPLWANYFLGILYQLQAKGLQVKPFTCVFDGDLPLGAGLSSSAAMECGFIYALNEMNDLKLSKLRMIQMAQWAEHNYVGVQCGIMDQFSSMMGKANHAMVLDCRNLTYNYFQLDLKSYCILLCDTKVKHTLASSEYNTRRWECETGVQILQTLYPNIKSLRDAKLENLVPNKDLFPEKIYDRCLYVIEENERVKTASEDLRNGELKAFGEKMFLTHTGLSELYEVSCPELDFLVNEAKNFSSVIGSRMMGGGFGGCTINIIEQHAVGEFVHTIRQRYKDAFGMELATYFVSIGNGTSVLESSLK